VDGGCWFTVVGQLMVIEIFLASNLGSKAEYPRVFWEYSYGQGQWPLWHSVVLLFVLLLFLPKSSMSPLDAFPSLSIFFTRDSQIRSARTRLKVVLLLKYSSVAIRYFTFLLRFLSLFLSFCSWF